MQPPIVFPMFLFRSTGTQHPGLIYLSQLPSPSPGTSNKTVYVRLNPKAVLFSLNPITHTGDCFQIGCKFKNTASCLILERLVSMDELEAQDSSEVTA